MIRIAHLADQHWSAEHLEKNNTSARYIEKILEEKQPNLIVIAGDLQDRMQRLVGTSAVTPMIDHVQALASIAPVFIIYGNEEHDPKGSLEVFRRIEGEYQIIIAERANNYVLYPNRSIIGLEWNEDIIDLNQDMLTGSLMIHSLPYPTKEWLLQELPTLAIDEMNRKAQEKLRELFLGFAAYRRKHGGELPSLLVGHCNVTQSKLSNGQTLISQDLMVSADDILLADATYGAFGHIHLPQEFAPNHWYCGSMAHLNFGEIEPKQFNIVDIEGRAVVNTEHIPLPTRPMSLQSATWNETGLHTDLSAMDIIGAEVRVRVKCRKEFSDFVNLDEVRRAFPGADSIKIEKIIEPEERIARSGIQKAKNLREKVAEFQRAAGQTPSESLLEKADKVAREIR